MIYMHHPTDQTVRMVCSTLVVHWLEWEWLDESTFKTPLWVGAGTEMQTITYQPYDNDLATITTNPMTMT